MLPRTSRSLTTVPIALAFALGLLLTSGCGNSGGSDALQPGMPQFNDAPAQLSDQAYASQGIAQLALGIYTVDLDPDSLSASVRARELRTGMANDDLFLLSIDSFLNASSFQLTAVTGTDTTVDLTYRVTHPFPAPANPAGTPNGSTNRADLGVSGMVLFLAKLSTATGATYFANRAANTDLVANADAYYCPTGLLTQGGVANTFPYRQLVDESANGTGTRDGVSNAGNVTGNFGADGWTRSEFGPGSNGWTGYGVLHQGQASTNVVSLNKSELDNNFSLDVAIIAKYNDPRNGATAAAKKANRLPPATPDATKFAYRMPHGALDGNRIEFVGESGGFVANTISASTLRVKVEDWDARATETTESDLSLDPDVRKVAVGESGVPLVEVCIPGVLGDFSATAEIDTVIDDDTAYGGDAGVDSGHPGDALFYEALVTKNSGSGQTAGTYTGMVRVTDPETGLVIGLNENLAPLATPPAPVTYQVLTVDLDGANTPPTATYSLTAAQIASGSTITIDVMSVTDPESDAIDVEVDWENTGAWTLAGTISAPYPFSNQFTSPMPYTFSGEAPDIRSLPVRINDGSGPVDLTPLATFEVTEPAPPFVSYAIPLPECALGYTDVHVATDFDQRPVIVYRDACTDMLMYARPSTNNPDGPEDWPLANIHAIDPATGKGRYSSLIMNFSTLPTVSYYDATNGNLKVAIAKIRRPLLTTDWNRMTVDSSQDVGTYSSLMLLPSGRLGVAYHRVTDGDLRVAFTSRNNPALSTDWPASQKYTLADGALPLVEAGNWNSAAVVNGRATVLSIENGFAGPTLMLRQAAIPLPPALTPTIDDWTALDITRAPGGGAPDFSVTDLVEANGGFAALYQSFGPHVSLISPTGAPESAFDLFGGDLPGGGQPGSQIAAVGECPTMHVVMDNLLSSTYTVGRANVFPPTGPGELTWATTELPGGTQVDCGCAAGKLFVVATSGRDVMAHLATEVW